MPNTLYSINQRILNLGHVDETTGEWIVDEEELQSLIMEREAKLEGIICWIKNLKAENIAIKAEEQVLKARRIVNEHLIARLERYIQEQLAGEKFKTARCAVSYRKSTQVVVDEANLPRKWFKKKVEYVPDKVALKDWISAGHKVKGASIEEKNNIVIK